MNYLFLAMSHHVDGGKTPPQKKIQTCDQLQQK